MGNANSEIVGQFKPSMIVGVVCNSIHFEGIPEMRELLQQRERIGSTIITLVSWFLLKSDL